MYVHIRLHYNIQPNRWFARLYRRVEASRAFEMKRKNIHKIQFDPVNARVNVEGETACFFQQSKLYCDSFVVLLLFFVSIMSNRHRRHGLL